MNTDFIMKPGASLLTRVSQNKHTSVAGGVYFGSIFLVRFLKIWMPAYGAQLDSTEELIKGAAVGYGLLMAGDSKPADKNN